MRATIVAAKDNAGEFEQMSTWLERWRSQLLLCSDELGCGCCVQMRNVDAPADALAELPAVMLSDSEWSRTGAG